jgi:hypothetical protein
MYKISYSSLDEVWGEKENDTSSTPYQTLKEQSEKNRLRVVDNLNQMESENRNQNVMKETSYGNYGQYPSEETVSQRETGMGSRMNNTSPIKQDPNLEKSELLEKLIFLENQMKKYNERLSPYERIESFSNQGTEKYNSFLSCDMFDIVVLIGMGMFIIFVMDSIFKMGKSMGQNK